MAAVVEMKNVQLETLASAVSHTLIRFVIVVIVVIYFSLLLSSLAEKLARDQHGNVV